MRVLSPAPGDGARPGHQAALPTIYNDLMMR